MSERRRIGAGALAGLIAHAASGRGPFYRRLATAVADAIAAGHLPAGSLLPSERQLATRLGVARGTVVAAYEQLAAEGAVIRRQGSGTWVAETAGVDDDGVDERDAGLRARRLTEGFFRAGDDLIDLAPAVVPNLDGLPAEAFAPDLRVLETMAAGHGYLPLGLPALRERLALLHTEHGLATRPAQVGVTVGALQAITLSVRLLVRPGDTVVVEEVTFPGVLDVLSRAGARFATVRSDGGGVRPDDLARVVERARPRLVYLVPTCHNPTGTILPDHRRAEVAAIIDRSDTWLVEDESLAWSAADGRRPPAVACHARSDRVITIGSLAKVLWGGLRVGWVRAADAFIERLGRLKAAEDLGGDVVAHAIALRLLDQYDATVAARRDHLNRNRARVLGLLAELLPDWRADAPAGGVCLWVRLPAGTADELLPVAEAHGVSFLPGGAASAREAHLDHMRLALTPAPAVLEEGVRRLADAWAAHRPGSAVPPIERDRATWLG